MSTLALYRGIYTQESFQEVYGVPLEPESSLAGMVKGRLSRCCRCSKSAALHLFRSRLPIASWLPKYQPKKWLLGDLVAGLTVGVVHIPQGEFVCGCLRVCRGAISCRVMQQKVNKSNLGARSHVPKNFAA